MIDEALEYLNNTAFTSMKYGLVVRETQGAYGVFEIDDPCNVKRIMTAEEVIADAEHYRRVLWRRKHFKALSKEPLIIQCSVCREIFTHCDEHEVPCEKMATDYRREMKANDRDRAS